MQDFSVSFNLNLCSAFLFLVILQSSTVAVKVYTEVLQGQAFKKQLYLNVLHIYVYIIH